MASEITIDHVIAGMRIATTAAAIVGAVVAIHYVVANWQTRSVARAAWGSVLMIGLAAHQFGFWLWQMAQIAGRPEIAAAISSNLPFTVSTYTLLLLGLTGVVSGFLYELFGRFWAIPTAFVVSGTIACGTVFALRVSP